MATFLQGWEGEEVPRILPRAAFPLRTSLWTEKLPPHPQTSPPLQIPAWKPPGNRSQGFANKSVLRNWHSSAPCPFASSLGTWAVAKLLTSPPHPSAEGLGLSILTSRSYHGCSPCLLSSLSLPCRPVRSPSLCFLMGLTPSLHLHNRSLPLAIWAHDTLLLSIWRETQGPQSPQCPGRSCPAPCWLCKYPSGLPPFTCVSKPV